MHNKIKPDISRRLKIASGQLQSIEKMVVEDKPCEEILVQLLAVKGAISQVSKKIIESHIHHCISEGIANNNEDILEQIDEFSKILSKFI